MDVVLLHNEKAGDEDWTRKSLIKLVRRAGFRPTYHGIKEALAEPELLDHGEFVIVAGGDGAIRKVAMAALSRQRPIAPLPLGTANNIAHSLGLHQRPEKIVAGWRHARRRPYDLGVATGPWGRRHFIEGIGIGLISRAIAVLTAIDDVSVHEWKKAKHKLHRDACVAAALAHEMNPIEVELTIDGRVVSDHFLLLEVLNIRRAGPAVELAPRAKPADGRFDVVTVTAQQRRRLMNALKSRLADSGHVRGLTTRKARRVTLRAEKDCELRIDDSTVKLTAGERVKLTVARAALEFVLPR